MFGGPKDKTADTLVGKILLGNNELDENTHSSDVSISISNWKKSINIDFEASMTMGIKRKSYIIGQVFDYSRITGILI